MNSTLPRRLARWWQPTLSVERRIIVAVFLFPALALIGLFIIYPSLYSIILSLTNASLIRLNWDFVGFENFQRLLSDPEAGEVLRNTYVYVFFVILFQFGLGLGFALLLNNVKRGRGIYGALLFLPWVFSNIMAVTAWKWIFNDTYGLLNYYLGVAGIPPGQWLSNLDLAMVTVIVLNIWKGYPFSMVLELAGLQSIPPELYDAAKVDGAGALSTLRYITLPLMRIVIIANVILITVYTFNIFDLVYAMTGGGPVNATELIGIFMYRAAFISGRLGYGAAIAAVMFLLNILITVFYVIVLARRGATSSDM